MNKSFSFLPAGLRMAVVAVSFAVFALPAFAATTFYTDSVNGNDTTGNGSIIYPYKTFSKAYTSASAGDTIRLAGTFTWTDSDETGDTNGAGFTIAKNLTIIGQDTDHTIIQAASTASTSDRSVFTVTASSVTMKNLTIQNGVATTSYRGAGITVTNNGSAAGLTLQYVRVTNNISSPGTNNYGAGGIYVGRYSGSVTSNSTLTMSTSTVDHNTLWSYVYGAAGIFDNGSGAISIQGSTISYNAATSSAPNTWKYSEADLNGGLKVYSYAYPVVITNSTIYGNSTNSFGGGISSYGGGSSLTLTSNTIANNYACFDAAGTMIIGNSDTLYLKNNLIANNVASTSYSLYEDYYYANNISVTDNGYNLAQYYKSAYLTAGTDIKGVQAALNLDTSLAANGQAGGPQTLALLASSVAIDAGATSTANNGVNVPLVDQRGATRVGASVDIGAYEYGGTAADWTAPFVNLNSPMISESTSTTVTLSASATDDVGVLGVKLYVDGALQGNEVTNAPYTATFDSTATTSGSHFAFAVARDAAKNYATSSYLAFTVSNSGPTFSNVAISTTSTAATLTWTTSRLSSSQVYFGFSSNYSTSTAEKDKTSRVTSHTIILNGLVPCTKYHYQILGNDAVSNTGTTTDDVFWTSGCTGSAVISASNQQTVATTTGGTLVQENLTLDVPIGFSSATSSVTFQANQLESTAFFTSAGKPSDKIAVGSSVFHLSALIDATTSLSSFSSPLAVTLSYSASDVVGLDESTLKIYRYDGSSWMALDNCTVNTSAKTVKCYTNNFSDFTIFGSVPVSTQSESSSTQSAHVAGNGMIFTGSAADLSGYVAPRMQTVYPDGSVFFWDSSTTPPNTSSTSRVSASVSAKSSTKISFSRNLRRGMSGSDVKMLQVFLNTNGFRVAESGSGSPGNETDYFGRQTHETLIKFQEAHADVVLKTVGLSKGTGIFGPSTRSYVNSLP